MEKKFKIKREPNACTLTIGPGNKLEKDKFFKAFKEKEN